VTVPIMAIRFTGRFQFSVVVKDGLPDSRAPASAEGWRKSTSANLMRGEGARCANGRSGQGETQNATADPGEPRQSPDPHHYPLNPAEARTCINYLVDREGTYPFLLPSPHLRVHPVCRTTNCIIHHTRAIFAVIISAYARSKLLLRPPPLLSLSLFLSLCLPCPRSFAHLSGLLERSLIIARADTPAGEKRRGGDPLIILYSRGSLK